MLGDALHGKAMQGKSRRGKEKYKENNVSKLTLNQEQLLKLNAAWYRSNLGEIELHNLRQNLANILKQVQEETNSTFENWNPVSGEIVETPEAEVIPPRKKTTSAAKR